MNILRSYILSGFMVGITLASATGQAVSYGRQDIVPRQVRHQAECHVGGVVAQIASDHIAVETDSGVYYGIFYYTTTRFLQTVPHPAPVGQHQPTFIRRPQEEPRTPPQTISLSAIQKGDTILGFGQFDAEHHTVAANTVLKLDRTRIQRIAESHQVGRGCLADGKGTTGIQ